MTDRRAELDRFYGLLDKIEQRCGGPRRLADCTSASGWPKRGVYFFFEDGEVREDGFSRRVVRVGTHGLTSSATTLWKRLKQHKGTTNGANPGGGNHRGSVFRAHIGSALLASGNEFGSARETWTRGRSAQPEVRKAERDLERAVSVRVGVMPFLWLRVDDEPGPGCCRGAIEAGAIALLSNHKRQQIDPPSPRWLGRDAASEAIRESGLWNVNHVQQTMSGEFLAVMERWLK